MWSIATATVSFSEIEYWLGLGLWGLLAISVGGIILTALRGNTTEPLPYSSQEPKAPVYQQAA